MLVGHGNHPAPILRGQLFDLKTLIAEIVPDELGQDAGVDLSLLAGICGESVGTKFDLR